jgi:UDP-N-acetylglucosamine:LPS N-acetylglucosamine transferase
MSDHGLARAIAEPPNGIRVLVLCADIGEGHVTVARSLAADLTARDDVAAVELHTDLSVLGPRFGTFMTRGFHVHLDELDWSYELAYRVFFQMALPRLAGHLALAVLGARGLRRTIAAFRPDVVVTEYPVLSAALGQLRALGRMPVPICSSISDPAGLYYWAHRGIDLHLLSWPESLDEVERIAGPGRAAAVRPLIDQRFMQAAPRDRARAALELPDRAPVVLVSGGGWGIGDLAGATQVALAGSTETEVIALAGRSSRAREELMAAYDGDPRVRVLGFTEQMPDLLAAADVLIHTTGGTTALEARTVGCRFINYGNGVAHVRAHARAMAAQGLAEWAPDRGALGPALARALAAGRPSPLAVDELPSAASLVVRVASNGAAVRRG